MFLVPSNGRQASFRDGVRDMAPLAARSCTSGDTGCCSTVGGMTVYLPLQLALGWQLPVGGGCLEWNI
jgi:hypothetical protein